MDSGNVYRTRTFVWSTSERTIAGNASVRLEWVTQRADTLPFRAQVRTRWAARKHRAGHWLGQNVHNGNVGHVRSRLASSQCGYVRVVCNQQQTNCVTLDVTRSHSYPIWWSCKRCGDHSNRCECRTRLCPWVRTGVGTSATPPTDCSRRNQSNWLTGRTSRSSTVVWVCSQSTVHLDDLYLQLPKLFCCHHFDCTVRCVLRAQIETKRTTILVDSPWCRENEWTNCWIWSVWVGVSIEWSWPPEWYVSASRCSRPSHATSRAINFSSANERRWKECSCWVCSFDSCPADPQSLDHRHETQPSSCCVCCSRKQILTW